MRCVPRSLGLLLGTGVILTGCAQTPTASTVQVMPGPGKSFDAFQFDNTSCKQYAGQQVAGQADQANQRAVALSLMDAGVGMGDNANARATIQQLYDNAFSQCMYSKGNDVAGFAPVPTGYASQHGSAADPMVRSVQRELVRLKYLGGAADGVMGPRTSSAISGFEASNGMAMDGVASQTVLTRLRATQSRPATASLPNFVAPVTPGSPGDSAGASGFVAPVGATMAAPAPSGGFVAPVSPH